MSKINLKELRIEKGLTQKEVGKMVFLTQSAYSNIETGKRKPGIETAKLLGEFLGFDWWKIFEDNNIV